MARLEPPPREAHEELLRALDREPLAKLEPRLRRLMAGHEHYAERTGDTFYLVRTACNLGKHLLRSGDEPQRRAAPAAGLARLALRFEPANVFGWSLWRDALAAQGQLAAAELVGWEAIARFPEDPQWRTQLALLLADRLGRADEAETLLRETVRLFPADVVARTQLALVLADRLDRAGEAEALLRETIRLFPDNVVTRNQLALLLADRLGRAGEAETLLRETITLFPDDRKNVVVARTQLANILGRDRNTLSAAIAVLDEVLAINPDDRIAKDLKRRFAAGHLSHAPTPASPATPEPALPAEPGGQLGTEIGDDLAASARARRALSRLRAMANEGRELVLAEIDALLREDENFAYARYVAAAAGRITPSVHDTTLAVAFLAAARDGSTAALRALIGRAHGTDRIIVTAAAAAAGDAESKAELQGWLAQPANDFSPREQAVRSLLSRPGDVPTELLADVLASSLALPIAA